MRAHIEEPDVAALALLFSTARELGILISQKALIGESVSLRESLARSVSASSGTLDDAPVGIRPGRRTSDGYTNVQDHDKRALPHISQWKTAH